MSAAFNTIDLAGIASLLALAPVALLATLRWQRRAAAPLQRQARAAVDAAFGPRLARGHRPPADGRWHRLLREAHQAARGAGPLQLLSEFWLADSEARQWHVVVRSQHGVRPVLRAVPLSLAPAGIRVAG